PVVNNVVATVAHRTVAQAAAGIAPRADDRWLDDRDDSGSIRGVGMRPAPLPHRPPFPLPLPDEAAVALARMLHDRGEEVLGVNGALPTIDVFDTELARLDGGRVEVAMHTRLFELGELIPPAPVPGELVAATEDQVDLAIQWYAEFID